MMVICPFLVIMSSSVTVFITTQVTLITTKIEFLGLFSNFIFFTMKLFPYCVIWILFTFIYIFMPNSKVEFKSGLLAGVIAGTLYQLTQWGYIHFQVGVAKYNAIYGSFAALPLFLLWLQLSWLIVLFGAEISFAHQNVDLYEFEPDCLRANQFFKKLVGLRIVHLLIDNFSQGAKPFTATKVSQALELPIRLVRQVLYELVECEILSETKAEEYKEVAYQPARDTDTFTVEYVINALEKRGIDTIPVVQGRELSVLTATLQTFEDIIRKSPGNKLLKDI